ncbi:MAG: dihydroorotate dehydrogenase electron transfer subunit [Candidatus Lokiarchaeota archaeon]|nr:dihydroorotate dehydrogenase electron transfer subunit [Candidatus Lokiarchaeota archaeon]
MTENVIKTVRVQKIIDECKDVKTLVFKSENYIFPKPGQFIMVWVPGVDEVPMSISGCDNNNNWAITVKNVGECTNAMFNLNIGDYIGVRGPLGNHFTLPNDNSKKIFLIGGGVGMAPLKFLSTELTKTNINHTIIEGAKIDGDLMFKDYFQEVTTNNSEVHYCTDDGSYGIKGVTSDIFEEMVNEFNKKLHSSLVVYSCGPEIMLYKLFQICQENKIEFYASLERIMRCGCGLCGLCAIDPIGMLVCKDGPIFNLEFLSKMEDFGNYKRNFTGKKISL